MPFRLVISLILYCQPTWVLCMNSIATRKSMASLACSSRLVHQNSEMLLAPYVVKHSVASVNALIFLVKRHKYQWLLLRKPLIRVMCCSEMITQNVQSYSFTTIQPPLLPFRLRETHVSNHTSIYRYSTIYHASWSPSLQYDPAPDDLI